MWLVFLERILNGKTVDEENLYLPAATKEGAEARAMEYYIEDGWQVVDAQVA